MENILVPLWILWLIFLLVLTFIWVRQSRALLHKLHQSSDFTFKGWLSFLKQSWLMSFPYSPDSELFQACQDYQKLLRVWLVVALLVVLTRALLVLLTA